MRGMYVLLKRRNIRLMKENSRLYKIIILSRLKNKDSNCKTHLALETLAEVAISLQDPEVAHDVADIPNIL